MTNLRDEELPKGYIDFCGYHEAAGAWISCGWIADPWDEGLSPDLANLIWERGDISGDCLFTFFHRDDLPTGGKGAIIVVFGPHASLGHLLSISVQTTDKIYFLAAAENCQRFQSADLTSNVRRILQSAEHSKARYLISTIISRTPYSGTDTLSQLTDKLFFAFDDVIVCGSHGIMLIGWFLAKSHVVKQIRVRCGNFSAKVLPEKWIRVTRPDVVSAVGREHGFSDAECGFIAFIPSNTCLLEFENAYLEVETTRGEIGFRKIPSPTLNDMVAIKRILSMLDLRYGDLETAFGETIGPAVAWLNSERMHRRTNVTKIIFGTPESNPRMTLIVPLYGRLDFAEYQIALFCFYAPATSYEILFVLDDPPRRRELERLFASLYSRFKVPFITLLLDRNMGYAPANNVGLSAARGEYVCFLNSDVFPKTSYWLDALARQLEIHEGLGAVGPILLFEDESIQHQGINFKQLPEFANWYFGQHSRKGMKKTQQAGLAKCESITGACLMMRKIVAEELGGFNEAFIIGDFEDTDLCLRLEEKGLSCAVDFDVELYHLERKSQAAPSENWRMNLTLYNAWVHDLLWGEKLRKMSELEATRVNRVTAP